MYKKNENLMRKIIFLKPAALCLFITFILVALSFFLFVKPNIYRALANRFQSNDKIETSRPNHIGEKIIYDVMLGRLRLGEARFDNIGSAEVNGKIVSLMIFETRLTRFRDTEKIYTDPQTLLPLKVERDILNWFVREGIVEEYNQDNFTATVIKTKGSKQEKLVIKKDSPIHNAILLPYYVRNIPQLDIGRIVIANLPTRRLEIKLVSLEEVRVPAGTFKAYHFTSVPRQINIWISADGRRIPIKIQGTGVFGYSLVMKEYSFSPAS